MKDDKSILSDDVLESIAQHNREELHTGRLLSGEITCGCGWRSGHFAMASDADEEFTEHLRDVGVTAR